MGCAGARTEIKKKKTTAEKGQERKWENRERDKEGLNGNRK